MNSTQARAALDQVMKNIAKAIDNGLHPDKAMDSAALILRESNPELPPLFWFSPEIAENIRMEAGVYYIKRHILNRKGRFAPSKVKP